MAKVLVTGGCGFIGRWLVKLLLARRHQVTVLDNFANGSEANIAAFAARLRLVVGDIRDPAALAEAFAGGVDVCYHLAASINVQDSIDDPRGTFDNDVVGTFEVLERCRAAPARLVFVSTCMVYARSEDDAGISERHPTLAASPYAGAKLASEQLALSYHRAYGLPVTVLRPFNTYGPFQKSSGEGGVVAVFLGRALAGQELHVFGDGTQTRDLLYVEDCARFIAAAAAPAAAGEIINAGTGHDVAIADLAGLIEPRPGRVRCVPHIHPQSEIARLRCDSRKARELLGWAPRVDLAAGIAATRNWLAARAGQPSSA